MLRRLKFALFLAAAEYCIVGSAWADGLNLVQNGDFTDGTAGTCDNSPCGSSQIPTSWILDPADPNTSSNLNVVNAAFFTGTGVSPLAGYSGDYVTFQSASTSGQDCLLQVIQNTYNGEQFTLTFYLALVGAGSDIYLAPSWDDNDSSSPDYENIYNVDGNNTFSDRFGDTESNTQPVQFEQIQETITASTTSTDLFFHGTDNGGAIVLANVSLNQVSPAPEPASLYLLGVGLTIGLTWARRMNPSKQPK